MSTPSRMYRQALAQLGLEATSMLEYNKDRETYRNLMSFMNKTAQMFEYDNLPTTLPAIALERILQLTGGATIVRIDNPPTGYGPSFNSYLVGGTEESSYLVGGAEESSYLVGPPIYAFPVNFAEAPDPYGEPYQVIVTSPGFNPTVSQTYTINKDAIVIRNDTYMRGLHHIHSKYAALLTEAEISLQSTLVTLRDHMTFVVRTSQQKKAVDQYLADLAAGKYGAIMSSDMGTPMEPIAHDGRSNAVELAVNGIQAIKSAWYNEIGLNPSFSLKREYTSAQEIDTNTDLLMPIIDDMLRNRELGVAQINAMFGTNISVRKSSAWAIKQQEADLALEAEEAQAEASYLVGDEEPQEQKEES